MKIGSNVFGKILRVDLTKGTFQTEPSEPYARRFLGGRGVNQWILHQEQKPWMTPFDPATRIVLGTGPLVGTLVPTACRLNIDSKNPLTGGIGSSNAGGHFAPELRFAGYSHIVIKGKSQSPVYLLINDDYVELKDASHVWGKTTWDTEDIIKSDLNDPKVQVLSIGPAGENLVRVSAIILGKSRAAGRCGLAAVLGSKNLKGIAVRGTGSINVTDPEGFMNAINEAWAKIEKCEGLKPMGEYGTHAMAAALNEICCMPTRNFLDSRMDPEKLAKLSSDLLHEKYEEAKLACFSCPIHCSHYYSIKEGPYAGTSCEGIEANVFWDFGSRLDIDYLPALVKAHEVCSRYGLDIDNSSCVIAWAFECFEKEILSKQDADGLELNWGNYDAALKLLRKISLREGLGDILAEGSKRASQIIGKGSEKYVVAIKGQDNMDAMRVPKGFALGVAVSPRGGGHTRGSPETDFMMLPSEIGQKIWGVPTTNQPTAYEGKSKLVVYYEKVHAISDSLGICHFSTIWTAVDLLGPEDFASLWSTATGMKIDSEEIMKIGDKIHHLEKTFNIIHAGFDRSDDYPPKRIMEEPVQSGRYKGERLEKAKWDKLLDEYYELHGWEKKTSWPTEKTLLRLGLNEIVEVLKRMGRIGSD